MDIAKILADLRAERELVNQAIASLERLTNGGRGRGRPRSTESRGLEITAARAETLVAAGDAAAPEEHVAREAAGSPAPAVVHALTA